MSAEWQVFAATFGAFWLGVGVDEWFRLLGRLSRQRQDQPRPIHPANACGTVFWTPTDDADRIPLGDLEGDGLR